MYLCFLCIQSPYLFLVSLHGKGQKDQKLCLPIIQGYYMYIYHNSSWRSTFMKQMSPERSRRWTHWGRPSPRPPAKPSTNWPPLLKIFWCVWCLPIVIFTSSLEHLFQHVREVFKKQTNIYQRRHSCIQKPFLRCWDKGKVHKKTENKTNKCNFGLTYIHTS